MDSLGSEGRAAVFYDALFCGAPDFLPTNATREGTEYRSVVDPKAKGSFSSLSSWSFPTP